MPQYFDGATAQNPSPPYTLTELGTFAIKTGGGCLNGSPVVLTAGDATSIVQLYDGTVVDGAASGQLIATFTGGIAGRVGCPNQSFIAGLVAVGSGVTSPTVQISYN
jgi:hypothetical protein